MTYHSITASLTPLALMAVLAYSTPASAVSIKKEGFIRGGVPTLTCTLQVDFGSAAGGPDMDAWQAIRGYIADSKEIDQADAWGWGREGEFSVCLRIEDAAAAKTVLDDLTKLAPVAPAANGGWTKVTAGTAKKE